MHFSLLIWNNRHKQRMVEHVWNIKYAEIDAAVQDLHMADFTNLIDDRFI